MGDSGERCMKCQTEISPEAVQCPQCGYEPGEVGGWITVLIVVASIGLILTGEGAIIGVPMLIALAVIEYRVKQRRPTTHDPS